MGCKQSSTRAKVECPYRAPAGPPTANAAPSAEPPNSDKSQISVSEVAPAPPEGDFPAAGHDCDTAPRSPRGVSASPEVQNREAAGTAMPSEAESGAMAKETLHYFPLRLALFKEVVPIEPLSSSSLTESGATRDNGRRVAVETEGLQTFPEPPTALRSNSPPHGPSQSSTQVAVASPGTLVVLPVPTERQVSIDTLLPYEWVSIPPRTNWEASARFVPPKIALSDETSQSSRYSSALNESPQQQQLPILRSTLVPPLSPLGPSVPLPPYASPDVPAQLERCPSDYYPNALAALPQPQPPVVRPHNFYSPPSPPAPVEENLWLFTPTNIDPLPPPHPTPRHLWDSNRERQELPRDSSELPQRVGLHGPLNSKNPSYGTYSADTYIDGCPGLVREPPAAAEGYGNFTYARSGYDRRGFLSGPPAANAHTTPAPFSPQPVGCLSDRSVEEEDAEGEPPVTYLFRTLDDSLKERSCTAYWEMDSESTGDPYSTHWPW